MQFIYFLKLFLLIHFSYCKPLINDYPEFYVVVFFFCIKALFNTCGPVPIHPSSCTWSCVEKQNGRQDYGEALFPFPRETGSSSFRGPVLGTDFSEASERWTSVCQVEKSSFILSSWLLWDFQGCTP